MMLKILLSNKAAEDLKNIGRYTEERWGEDQRNRYLSKLDDGIQTLAKHPLTGPSCDEILSGYRKYYVGKHLIFTTMTLPKYRLAEFSMNEWIFQPTLMSTNSSNQNHIRRE